LFLALVSRALGRGFGRLIRFHPATFVKAFTPVRFSKD
jgi:hypothetical protein